MRIRTLAASMIFTVGLVAGALEGYLQAQPSAQDSEIFAQLTAYAESARQQWGVPGMAVAVVRNDQVVYAKGFGVKRAGGTEPVDPDTLFQIGSTSKAFTGALMAMQVDTGKVKWTDRVMDHLPAFVMYDPWVTREFQVRDLMAQHSGQPAYAGDGLAILGFSADEIVARMRLIKPVSSFRSEFAYVNNLFLVAGDLMQRSSGLSWAENLRKNIFEPLGMGSSSSSQAKFHAASDAASPHKLVNGTIKSFPGDAPQTGWAYTYGPAGGINSTVMDMSKWLRLLLGHGTFEGKELVSAKNLDFVMSPQTIIQAAVAGPMAKTPQAGYRNYYCNGWVYTAAQPQPIIWHNGDNNYMHAAIGVIPQANTGIVILTNLGGVQLAEAVMWKYYDMVFHNPPTDWSAKYREAFEEQLKATKTPFSQPPADATPAQPFSRYTGTFTNPCYGELSVESDGKSLWLTIGPKKVKIDLVHWSHDTFIVSEPNTDAFLGDSGFARFAFGNDGKVASIALSLFADVDNGKFTAE